MFTSCCAVQRASTTAADVHRQNRVPPRRPPAITCEEDDVQSIDSRAERMAAQQLRAMALQRGCSQPMFSDFVGFSDEERARAALLFSLHHIKEERDEHSDSLLTPRHKRGLPSESTFQSLPTSPSGLLSRKPWRSSTRTVVPLYSQLDVEDGAANRPRMRRSSCGDIEHNLQANVMRAPGEFLRMRRQRQRRTVA